MPRSRLFKRNAVTEGLLRRRSSVGASRKLSSATALSTRRAAPHPAPSRAAINDDTVKTKTFGDTSYNANSNTTNPGIVMDIVARGSGDNERIGAKWRETAIHVKGQIDAIPGVSCIAGFYLVWDSQPNQATAVFGSVFTNTPSFEFYAASTSDRFKVLYKKQFYLTGPSSPASGDLSHVAVDSYVKLPKNLIAHATLTGTTGVIGNRQTGVLLMFPFSNVLVGVQPAFRVSHRLYFEDV